MDAKLDQLLNNPDAMAQILSMASGMSGPSEANASPLFDENMLFTMMELMQQLQKTDARQDALLCALRAYLTPERQAKLDRAMQLAKLSNIAGFALKNYGGLLGR